MRRALVYWCGLCALSLTLPVSAYEQATHRGLSEKAAEASVLKDANGVLKELGLKTLRDPNQTFPNSKGDNRILLDLIKDGADFEDDGKRPVNHFFDPLRNQPLRPYGVPLLFNHTSPDWTLEDNQEIGDQLFSWRDGRKYFYQALITGSQSERDVNFGKTFQTLGQIIHHLQDMAQPQHVRNDARLDNPKEFYFLGVKIPNPAYNPSLYEEYTKKLSGNLPFGGYLKVKFTKPRDFWITGDGTGQGLAEFTNANFVSAGTNYQLRNDQPAPNARYPQPVPQLGESIHIKDLLKEEGKTTDLDGYVDFVANTVTDALTGESKPNPRSATYSIFDQDLKTYNKTITYDADPLDPSFNIQVTVDKLLTLNRFNYKKTHEFLIPRAVAYSSGLLDYFFRGKLETQDVGFTDTGISLRVKNAIDPNVQPAWEDETMPRSHA